MRCPARPPACPTSLLRPQPSCVHRSRSTSNCYIAHPRPAAPPTGKINLRVGGFPNEQQAAVAGDLGQMWRW